MYNLIEYYEEKDIVKWHIVDFADTKSEIDIKKREIAKELKTRGIDALEIIVTKDINSIKKILRKENNKMFQVVVANTCTYEQAMKSLHTNK